MGDRIGEAENENISKDTTKNKSHRISTNNNIRVEIQLEKLSASNKIS